MATGRVPTTANSPLTAKGDLFGYSTTQARVAVGNDGETLVADSSTSTGLRWQGDYAAGKNKIINGDFGIWQRGTSFTTGNEYTADRFFCITDGTNSWSRQSFTAGTAPVSGYEAQYFLRGVKLNASGTFTSVRQRIEDVRTFAGQTFTVSFWAKTDTAQTIYCRVTQEFGTGGSSLVQMTPQTATTSTSWTRYSFTFTAPSIAGKTIGTGSLLSVENYIVTNGAVTFDTWGWQVEAGSTATAFQTATGTIQGELAACQRYYYRNAATANAFNNLGTGTATSTTNTQIVTPFPVSMRVAPTSVDYSTLAVQDGVTRIAVTSLSLGTAHNMPDRATVFAVVASGLTQYRLYFLEQNNNTAGYLGFSAEL